MLDEDSKTPFGSGSERLVLAVGVISRMAMVGSVGRPICVASVATTTKKKIVLTKVNLIFFGLMYVLYVDRPKSTGSKKKTNPTVLLWYNTLTHQYILFTTWNYS